MKKIIFMLCLSGFITACDDRSFEEINTNTNVPVDGSAGNLISGVIFNTADAHYNYNTSVIDELMQYRVNIDGGGQLDFRNGIWGTVYAALSNIIDIEAKVDLDQGLAGYAAIGKILKAYNAALLTEMYIDVPFSEAAQGLSGIIQPSYDTQEAIFDFIFTELEQANALINDDLALSQGGDLVYGGDLKKWQKLANSLHLRYLLRVSNVIDVSSKMEAIVSQPNMYPIFESNTDNALLDYTGDIPFLGPLDVLTSSEFDIRGASKFYVDVTQPSNDPRLDFFFCKPANTSINTFVGVPPGLSGTDFNIQFPQGSMNVSLINQRFFNTKGLIDYAFMTYSELNFILAEAALKNYISGDAETYYTEGVTSSIEYWGLSVPTDFFTEPNVTWDNTLETIMNQKWIAAFKTFNFELWSDYKRTGLPDFNLPVLTFPSTDGEIPTRMIYPFTEQTLNKSNYESAVQNIGGDNSLSTHWYQGN